MTKLTKDKRAIHDDFRKFFPVLKQVVAIHDGFREFLSVLKQVRAIHDGFREFFPVLKVRAILFCSPDSVKAYQLHSIWCHNTVNISKGSIPTSHRLGISCSCNPYSVY
jgi:hypothetical protein